MKSDQEISRKLKAYIPLVKFLARFLGNNCEVVLHDVRNIEKSIVAIQNNHISGRTIGDPLKNLGPFFKEQKNPTTADFIKPRITTNERGKKLKTASYLIKDEDGDLIGLPCLNLDLSRFDETKELLNEYFLGSEIRVQLEPQPVSVTEDDEEDSIEDLTYSIIKDTIHSSSIPPSRMTPDEKMEIVEKLKGRGVFLLRGALGEVATLLETSENSIYRYLNKITNNGN